MVHQRLAVAWQTFALTRGTHRRGLLELHRDGSRLISNYGAHGDPFATPKSRLRNKKPQATGLRQRSELLIRKPMLYPLSYEGAMSSVPTPVLTCAGISRPGVARVRSGW
jgi:hypothetical protein